MWYHKKGRVSPRINHLCYIYPKKWLCSVRHKNLAPALHIHHPMQATKIIGAFVVLPILLIFA